MGKPATQLKAPLLQKLEPYILDYVFTDTAKTISLAAHQMGYPIIHGHDAGDFVQATVDSFLGITNDVVVATSFGSTAMGTDAYGFIINCQGQAASAAWAEMTVNMAFAIQASTTVLQSQQVIVVGAGLVTTALPNTLTAGFAVTAGGNIYGRLICTGLDAGTGPVHVRLGVYLK
jgi:hypothetical protein